MFLKWDVTSVTPGYALHVGLPTLECVQLNKRAYCCEPKTLWSPELWTGLNVWMAALVAKNLDCAWNYNCKKCPVKPLDIYWKLFAHRLVKPFKENTMPLLPFLSFVMTDGVIETVCSTCLFTFQSLNVIAPNLFLICSVCKLCNAFQSFQGWAMSFFCVQAGTPSWTGRTCCQEARSRGWAWLACSTTSKPLFFRHCGQFPLFGILASAAHAVFTF